MREGSFCYIVSSFDNNLLGCGEGWGLSNQPWSKHTMYHVLNLVLTRPLFLVLGVEGRGELVNELFIYIQIEWIIFSRYLTSDKGAAPKGWQIALYLKVYQPKRNHKKRYEI